MEKLNPHLHGLLASGTFDASGKFRADQIRRTLHRAGPNLTREAYNPFCQIDERAFKATAVIPLAMFREAEGITVIYPVAEATELGFAVVWIGTLITLNINSSLDAVGFLARITAALASANISVNAFSPVSHDHLFVRPEDADKAMKILRSLTQQV